MMADHQRFHKQHKQLMDMGFKSPDATSALQQYNGNVEMAADWLSQSMSSTPPASKPTSPNPSIPRIQQRGSRPHVGPGHSQNASRSPFKVGDHIVYKDQTRNEVVSNGRTVGTVVGVVEGSRQLKVKWQNSDTSFVFWNEAAHAKFEIPRERTQFVPVAKLHPAASSSYLHHVKQQQQQPPHRGHRQLHMRSPPPGSSDEYQPLPARSVDRPNNMPSNDPMTDEGVPSGTGHLYLNQRSFGHSHHRSPPPKPPPQQQHADDEYVPLPTSVVSLPAGPGPRGSTGIRSPPVSMRVRSTPTHIDSSSSSSSSSHQRVYDNNAPQTMPHSESSSQRRHGVLRRAAPGKAANNGGGGGSSLDKLSVSSVSQAERAIHGGGGGGGGGDGGRSRRDAMDTSPDTYDTHVSIGDLQGGGDGGSDEDMEGIEGEANEYEHVLNPGAEGRSRSQAAAPDAEFHFKKIPYKTQAEVKALKVGEFVDHRDVIGKFVSAEVIERRGDAIKLHYIKWPSKWDRWIQVHEPDVYKDFAVFHTVAEEKQPLGGLPFAIGDFIQARPMYYRPDIASDWSLCEIKRIDKMQLQVCVEKPPHKPRLFWLYGADIDEVKEMDSGVPPNNEQPGGEGSSSADDDFTEDESVPTDPANTHEVGMFIEVRGKDGSWMPAMVIKKKGTLIRVHSESSHEQWEETLDIHTHKDRIRVLGSGLEESEIEEKNRIEMERFVSQIKSNKWEMREVEADGNCLFRSIADQIYDDVTRHREVRDDCCDYMVDNRSFFAGFEPEFDDYIAKKRDKKDPSWGDHVDIMAMCEMYNLKIHVLEVDNLESHHLVYGFCDMNMDLPLVRVSRHRQTHYNSVRDPRRKYPLKIADWKKGDRLYVREKRIADDEKAAADIKQIKDKSEAAEAAEAKSTMVDDLPPPPPSGGSSPASSRQRRQNGPASQHPPPPRGSHQRPPGGGPPGLSQGGDRRPSGGNNHPPTPGRRRSSGGGGNAQEQSRPTKKELDDERREKATKKMEQTLAGMRISKDMLRKLWRQKTTKNEILEQEARDLALEVLKTTRDILQNFWSTELQDFDVIILHGAFQEHHENATNFMIDKMREKQRKRLKGGGDFPYEAFCKGVMRHLLPHIERKLATLIVEQRSQLADMNAASASGSAPTAASSSSVPPPRKPQREVPPRPSAPSAPPQLDRKASGRSQPGIIGRWRGRSGQTR